MVVIIEGPQGQTRRSLRRVLPARCPLIGRRERHGSRINGEGSADQPVMSG